MESLDAYFSEPGLEELRGMADGAGLPLEILAGLNIALMRSCCPDAHTLRPETATREPAAWCMQLMKMRSADDPRPIAAADRTGSPP
jgi:hypothetical protein